MCAPGECQCWSVLHLIINSFACCSDLVRWAMSTAPSHCWSHNKRKTPTVVLPLCALQTDETCPKLRGTSRRDAWRWMGTRWPVTCSCPSFGPQKRPEDTTEIVQFIFVWLFVLVLFVEMLLCVVCWCRWCLFEWMDYRSESMWMILDLLNNSTNKPQMACLDSEGRVNEEQHDAHREQNCDAVN